MMSTARNPWAMSWVLICLTALGLMVGCDGDGINSNFAMAPTSTQKVMAGITDTIDWVSELMIGDGTAMTTDASPTLGLLRMGPPNLARQQGDVELSLPCMSGSVTLGGNIDTTHVDRPDTSKIPFILSASVNFTQCDGRGGTLTLASEGSVEEDSIVYLMALNGTVQADTCSITLDQLTVKIEANASGLLTAPFTVNGTTKASCEKVPVSCVLNNMDIDDFETFESSCTNT